MGEGRCTSLSTHGGSGSLPLQPDHAGATGVASRHADSWGRCGRLGLAQRVDGSHAWSRHNGVREHEPPAHSQDVWQKEDSQSSWSAAKNSDALSMDSLIDDGGVRRPEAHIPFSPGSFSWGINLDDGICRFLDEENTM